MKKADIFRIVDFDPDELRAEQDRLAAHLRKITGFREIKPVGSTAVEGVIGKGDLDFGLGVARETFAEVRSALDGVLQRDPHKSAYTEFQPYCVPSDYDATLLLFVSGGEYDVFDPFIELLRTDAGARDAYIALKRQWDGKPMDAYREAKREFIEAVLGLKFGH